VRAPRSGDRPASASAKSVTALLIPDDPDWMVADGDDQDNFAATVGTAGDVNGDDYSDVLIACPGLNGDDGGAFVYCGGPGGLSASACWLGAGTQAGRLYSGGARERRLQCRRRQWGRIR
jgi:hypothetical protein